MLTWNTFKEEVDRQLNNLELSGDVTVLWADCADEPHVTVEPMSKDGKPTISINNGY